MADFLSPILDACVTGLQTDLPGEIDSIDASLDDIPNANYFKAMLQPQSWPGDTIEIFPFGDSDIDADYTMGTQEILWRIAIFVTINGEDEEDLQSKLNKYTTAIIKATAKYGEDWTIGSTSDIATPVSLGFATEGDSETIMGTGVILWQVRKEYDMTS